MIPINTSLSGARRYSSAFVQKMMFSCEYSNSRNRCENKINIELIKILYDFDRLLISTQIFIFIYFHNIGYHYSIFSAMYNRYLCGINVVRFRAN